MAARVIPFPRRAGPADEAPREFGREERASGSSPEAADGRRGGGQTILRFATALEAVLALSADKLGRVTRSARRVVVTTATGAGEFSTAEWDAALRGRFQ